MFCLEYEQPYIVKTELTRNRTCQSFRWKQCAICESKKELEKILKSKKDPRNWRVVPLASSL